MQTLRTAPTAWLDLSNIAKLSKGPWKVSHRVWIDKKQNLLAVTVWDGTNQYSKQLTLTLHVRPDPRISFAMSYWWTRNKDSKPFQITYLNLPSETASVIWLCHPDLVPTDLNTLLGESLPRTTAVDTKTPCSSPSAVSGSVQIQPRPASGFLTAKPRASNVYSCVTFERYGNCKRGRFCAYTH